MLSAARDPDSAWNPRNFLHVACLTLNDCIHHAFFLTTTFLCTGTLLTTYLSTLQIFALPIVDRTLFYLAYALHYLATRTVK